MNVEKQTYFNTEQLQSLLEKQGEAVECFGSGSRYGGVRFTLHAQSKVALEVAFDSISATASICLDGAIVAKTAKKVSRFEVLLGKGEHVFDVDCATHGGFVIRVSGTGLSEGARYFDRVGGYSSDGETVVYFSNGNRSVTRYRKTSSALQTSVISSPFYDAAQLYDKTNGEYTASVATVAVVNNGQKMHLYLGHDVLVQMGNVEGVAICDGRTLGAGADYLAVCVYGGGKAAFFRANDGGDVDETARCEWATSVLRVVSAQSGSILLMQNKNHVWTALYFHAEGENELRFTNHTFRYDLIPLCKNRYVAPTALADEDGAPIFYCKREDGKLVKIEYGASPVELGFQEAYHPGLSGGFWQYAGEAQYEAAE